MRRAETSSLSRNAAQSALSQLLAPVAEASFFDEIWESRPGWWRMDAPPHWLLGAADLAALLMTDRAAGTKPASLGRLTDGGYQHLDAVDEDGLLDHLALFRAWQDGFTLIVPELHRLWLPIALFADRVYEHTGLRAEINLYYTPANSIAFPAHYDTHDVLIIQLFGRKQWRLYPSPSVLPFPEEHFQDSSWARAPLENPTAQLELAAGHILYLPRGTIHAAEARQLPSLHLSIGLYPRIWRDIFPANAPARHKEVSDFRRGMSPRFYRDPVPENAPAALRRYVSSGVIAQAVATPARGSARDRSV